MSMKVQFESTPNPATLRFLLPVTVAEDTKEFTSVQETQSSPLANKLFGFPWMSGVLIGPQFVAVTKQDWVDWDVLAEPLAGLIQEHLESGQPFYLEPEVLQQKMEEDSAEDTPIVRQIKQILVQEIRPMVQLDGGDIVFYKYEDQVVYVHMKGACSGCASSQITLKEGIEVRLKQAIPEIMEVVSV